MTKSTITREQLLEIIETDHVQCSEASYLASMALAAMDSEPHTDDELSNLLWYSQEATCHSDPNYYCEFQRLATPGLIAGIILELQERRKADSEPVAVVELSDYVTAAQLVGEGPARKAVHELYEGALRIGDKLYRHAQTAPVVPDDVRQELSQMDDEITAELDAEESACRAATLQAGNSPAHHADRPVAWHHTAKCKDENYSTCCFSYSPTHDFGPWYEKPQSQPHYLPESLDYDRALHFLSTEPRKLTEESSDVYPQYDSVKLMPSTGKVIMAIPLSEGFQNTEESMLRRWLAFGRAMQNAGCQLPHNLIAETEAMLAAAPQEVKGE